jgi:hypothetical protein
MTFVQPNLVLDDLEKGTKLDELVAGSVSFGKNPGSLADETLAELGIRVRCELLDPSVVIRTKGEPKDGRLGPPSPFALKMLRECSDECRETK